MGGGGYHRMSVDKFSVFVLFPLSIPAYQWDASGATLRKIL